MSRPFPITWRSVESENGVADAVAAAPGLCISLLDCLEDWVDGNTDLSSVELHDLERLVVLLNRQIGKRKTRTEALQT